MRRCEHGILVKCRYLCGIVIAPQRAVVQAEKNTCTIHKALSQPFATVLSPLVILKIRAKDFTPSFTPP
jgi:hypothetical protein